jgi:hypothetical protein
MNSILITILFLACVCARADGRKVTFFHTSPMTNEIQIGEYESFKAVSGSHSSNLAPAAYFLKDGKRIDIPLPNQGFLFPPIELTGPAIVRLESTGGALTTFNGADFLTLEIQPQVFEANKTITLAPGAGAAITLEGSTNLVNWSSATNGVYTNLASAMFFRIKAERLPQ